MHWQPALVILLPDGVYRATAWVKAEPGMRVMIEPVIPLGAEYGKTIELRRSSI